MDWDKLRIFHAAADAGSFTHAGDALGLSQSAVSRQVSALEQDLDVPLFHRHARGLILTEQGELLMRTVKDVVLKLESARVRLTDNREKPNGELRITTTIGIGSNWLAPRLGEFLELYPDIRVNLALTDDELDLSMRAADVALRVREPVQPDLIRRRLFTMHFHAYASGDYLKRHGQPQVFEDLDQHRLLVYAGGSPGAFVNGNPLLEGGREAKKPRVPALVVNQIGALRESVEAGVGIGLLPDYQAEGNPNLVKLLSEIRMPELDCFLVYPEELKSVARIQVFRDFLVANAQRWRY